MFDRLKTPVPEQRLVSSFHCHLHVIMFTFMHVTVDALSFLTEIGPVYNVQSVMRGIVTVTTPEK